MDPFAIEEAALAVGGAEKPDGAAADGEHGAEGAVEFVADEGGFIEDEHGDGGEAAGGVFDVCDSDEARAIGEEYGVAICAIAARNYVEAAEKCFGFSDKFAALPFGGTGDEDEGLGDCAGAVDGFGGDDGGLSPLARAVEDDTLGAGFEDARLVVVGFELKEFAREVYGIEEERVRLAFDGRRVVVPLM